MNLSIRIFSIILSSFILLNSLSAEQEFKMAITGLSGLEELERDFGPFQDALNQASGLKIKLFPLSSRTVIVQSLKAKHVDLVLFGPAEYVVTRSKIAVQPIAGLSRTDYFSAIVTLSKNPIYQIQDLRGKKLGVGDFGSTAYHLSPLQLVKDAGLDPLKDLKPMNLAKKVSWEALKRGNIDALGIKHEQFVMFRDSEKPIAPEKYRVIARGPDLPDDILIAGEHVAPEVVTKLKNTLSKHSDALINAILEGTGNKKYKGMKFLADVTDEDYNSVRQMYKTVGYPEFSKKS